MLKKGSLLRCPDCGAELSPPTHNPQGGTLALAGGDVSPDTTQEIPCPLCGHKKTLKEMAGVMRGPRSARRWRFTYGGIL